MRFPSFVALLVSSAAIACGPSARSGDSDLEGDGDRPDADPEAGAFADASETGDGLVLPPQCGDGVVDEGEECDDRNRLDGDGCDWRCRVGDGEPVAEPDPLVPSYQPEGAARVLEGTAPTVTETEGFPLAWTGSELGLAIFEGDPVGESWIRFLRIERSGRMLDAGWDYPVVRQHGGLELLWDGGEYALFYADQTEGVLMLRLDEQGKPLGSPVLVVADPAALAPSADLTEEGFVLAWYVSPSTRPGYGWCTGGSGGRALIRARLVGADGETSGLAGPVTLEDHAGGPPDVVTGDGGFGVVMYVDGTRTSTDCSLRFVWASPDLGDLRYSGILSHAFGGEVARVDEGYRVAWTHAEDHVEAFEGEVCVGAYDGSGELERAPVCTRPIAGVPGLERPRLAAGDHGLGVVAGSSGRLVFYRTDLSGVRIGAPVGISDDWWFGPFAIAWVGDCFAVVHADSVMTPLAVTWLVPAR